jgi:hypothetical protein
MTLPKHLEEAARTMDLAMSRIDEVRQKPFTAENQREWLEALTDFCFALCDAQEFNNESVHEKLHELAGHVGPVRILLGKSRSER